MKTTIGIATMRGRELSLFDTVNSLKNQCDELHVYFNNFVGSDVPETIAEIKDCKSVIKVFRSENESGDLTDFGGFYKSMDCKGYFISCDDDLIYPSNFVENITKACERYDNKCIVGYHGRIYGNQKITSYYHGHSKLFHINSLLVNDTFTHVVAGCSLCFHTDTFNVDINHIDIIEYQRMKDIHIAILAQENHVPMVVLAHTGHEFKQSTKIDVTKSIHLSEHRTDSKQVTLFNSIKWCLYEYHASKQFYDNSNMKVWFLTNKGVYKFCEKKALEKYIKKGMVQIVDENDVPESIVFEQRKNEPKNRINVYKSENFEIKNIIRND